MRSVANSAKAVKLIYTYVGNQHIILTFHNTSSQTKAFQLKISKARISLVMIPRLSVE